MLKIDKGIEIPAEAGGRKGIYPFKEMEVGDSFLVECTKDKRRKKQASMLGAARRKKPFLFQTVSVDGGLRCWRIK